MRFGETIPRKSRHHLPDSFCGFLRDVVALLRTVDEVLFECDHYAAGIEMAHCPPKDIRLGNGQAAKLMSDPQHLFLIEDHAVCALQEVVQRGMDWGHFLFATKTADEGVRAGRRAAVPAGRGRGQP